MTLLASQRLLPKRAKEHPIHLSKLRHNPNRLLVTDAMTNRRNQACPPSTSGRSRIMAGIRSRGNRTTEFALARVFRSQKIKGWRRHLPLPGRPDFVFPRARLTIFVDGCFWHGCKRCYQAPRSNRAYWANKLRRNKARDATVSRILKKKGWKVCRVWEHSLKNPEKVAAKIRKILYA